MRRFMTIATFGAALAVAIWLALPLATAQDATLADANHHKVEFENEQVRVVRYTIAPHDKTAMHSHPKNVQIMLSDTNARITTPDGKTSEAHGKAGQVAWRTPVVHIVENIGDQPIQGILVEPKNAGVATFVETQDPVKVDPQHHKLEFENEQVRVLRYSYAPGDKSPMHQHPDNVQILLTDSTATITTADGKSNAFQGKAGEVSWRTATAHSAENTGNQPIEGILVEVKSAK